MSQQPSTTFDAALDHTLKAMGKHICDRVTWIEKSGSDAAALDAVYHSSSMHKMLVEADLQDVDLCNPYAMMWLIDQTTYHHAFWPHTAKRFTALKSILRRDRKVQESIKHNGLVSMVKSEYMHMLEECNSNPAYKTIGRKQELKNMKQVLDILEKISHEA